ncbi:MAG: PhoU domain-containing protein [candidate division WOR-3 bacterium]
MLFIDFFNIWRKSSLLKEATEETLKMLAMTKDMYEFSLRVLMDNEKEVADIYQIDQQLNQMQIAVRRKVLEHLSINPSQDVTGSLILVTIVVDIERIGDYAKNLIELAHHYPEKLCGSYCDRIRKLEIEITQNFINTIKAFQDADATLGQQVMAVHAKLAPEIEKIIEDILADTTLSGREAVIYALLARFLKRVSAHIKNVASSVVNPFHRLGYRPE